MSKLGGWLADCKGPKQVHPSFCDILMITVCAKVLKKIINALAFNLSRTELSVTISEHRKHYYSVG